jgi:hypothetical protein
MKFVGDLARMMLEPLPARDGFGPWMGPPRPALYAVSASLLRGLPREVNVFRSLRFSIAGLMGAVLVAAVGLAALHDSSATWSGVIFLLTCAILSLGIVGLVFGKAERVWWFGFSLFGWTYLAIALWSLFFAQPTLPTERLLLLLGPVLGPRDHALLDGRVRPVWTYTYLQIGHCLWALLSAVTGGLLARLFFGGIGARSSGASPEAPVAAPPAPAAPRYGWLKPAGFALAGFGAIALVLVAGSTLDPSIWAGTIFVLTVGLICMACLGACLGRARHREIWLGAALFGGGFMVAVFARSPAAEGSPSHPTVELLNAIRTRWRSSGGATPPSSIVAESNTRILQALEQPVTMRFAGESLADVIKYIQYATQSPDGHIIQVYVDPDPPELAGIFKREPLRIDLEGIPLETSLRLCLEQLDLTYEVREGMLFIASTERQEALRRQVLPPLDHSYQVTGHCVLALIAAVIGGVLAPIVSDRRPVPTPAA